MTLATTSNQSPVIWEMDEDMREELQLTRDVLPFLNFNGQDGVYADRSVQPYNPEQHPSALTGIILAVTYGQAYLAKDGEGWSQKWLCRAPNKLKPPIINMELSENERAELAGKGAGRSCQGCPLGAWLNREKPSCQAQIHLLILREADNSPAIVSFGGTSFATLDRFLGANFKRRSSPWYRWPVQFGRERHSQDGKSWWQATFQLGDEVSREQAAGLQQLRRQYLSQMDGTASPPPHVEAEAPATTSVATPAAPVQSKPAPAAYVPAGGQGTFALDDEGNPIWGGGGDAGSDIPF